MIQQLCVLLFTQRSQKYVYTKPRSFIHDYQNLRTNGVLQEGADKLGNIQIMEYYAGPTRNEL